jgi:hypothetical protein
VVPAGTSSESIPNRRLPPDRYALGLLARNRDGSTMTMLSARRVPFELIDKFIAAGLAVTIIERVGLVDITRVKITEAGRRAL